MAEKTVNVQVRMVLEGGRVVAKGIGTGIVLLESDWTPAMHAAAEELRAQGAELGGGEFIWRHERLSMRFVDDPGLGPGLAIVGHGIYAPDEIRRHAKRDLDPNGWPRALAFFEEHCGKTETPEQIAASLKYSEPTEPSERVGAPLQTQSAVLPEAHSGRFLAQQLLSLAGQLTQVAVAFAELEGKRGQS